MRTKTTKMRSNPGADEVGTSPALFSSSLCRNPVRTVFPASGQFALAATRMRGTGGDDLEPADRDGGDQDTGDLATGLDEDELEADPLDTDRVTSTDSVH